MPPRKWIYKKPNQISISISKFNGEMRSAKINIKAQSNNSSVKHCKTRNGKMERNSRTNALEHAKIRDCAGKLELAVLSGGHGGVDAEEAGGEDQEDSNGGRQLAAREREPLRFGLLCGGRIVLLGGGVLLVSRQPDAGVRGQIPRSSHWKARRRIGAAATENFPTFL